MMHTAKRAILTGAALAALLSGGAAWADVKAGVDAWSRGDYAAAVHEWQDPAAAGDADAMFNLGQAYRLGRGVAQDSAKAEELYARAAAKGHLRAADTYGLMLFQDGRREAAIPYIEDAARRGDPRSEYLLGIAYFNGDAVSKDWVKAYALLTMANAQGLPQAPAALAQMDEHIPPQQRQQAAALALDMQKEADRARGQALAAADLGAGVSAPSPVPVAARAPLRTAPTIAVASPQVPRPLAMVAVSPSVEAAREAVAEARQATGTESPADAGAGFARAPRARLAAAAPEPKALARSVPESKAADSTAPAPSPGPSPATRTSSPAGPWKVQLGAFSIAANADKLWAHVAAQSEFAGKSKLTEPAGSLTKLFAAGYISRDAAEDACRSFRRSGHDCLVTR